MKKQTRTRQAATCALHILALLGIFSIAFIALMGEPDEDSKSWFEIFFITKVIAVAGFYAFGKLYNRWIKTDKWLKAYDRACDEVCEAKNPMQL